MNNPHTPERAPQLSAEQLEAEQRRIRVRELLETLSDADREALLVEQIKDLPEGNKPYPVFLALAKKMPLATVEMVPLRTNPETGRTEVLLTQRPDWDVWAGEWHVPGATIVADDEPHGPPTSTEQFADVYGRLLGQNGELKSGVKPTQWPPTFLRQEMRQTKRGPESSSVTYVEVEGEPIVGEYVPVGETIETDKPIIGHHVQFIIDAARDYEHKRASNEAQGLQA